MGYPGLIKHSAGNVKPEFLVERYCPHLGVQAVTSCPPVARKIQHKIQEPPPETFPSMWFQYCQTLQLGIIPDQPNTSRRKRFAIDLAQYMYRIVVKTIYLFRVRTSLFANENDGPDAVCPDYLVG
jgi:hypothetical protein